MKGQLVEIKESKNKGKGLFAATDIKKGEVIVEVDESKFITYSMFAEHPVLGRVINQTEHKKIQFAYFMAYSSHEKEMLEENSSVHQYLETVPSYYHNLICWKDQELDELGNEALASRIKERKRTVESVFNQIQKLMLKDVEVEREGEALAMSRNQSKRGSRRLEYIFLRNKEEKGQGKAAYLQIIKKITLEEVINFMAMVESRNAYYPNQYDSGSAVGALIVELEMFNHKHQSKCKVDLVNRSYQVKAVTNIPKAEEIFVDYGPFTREEFLEFYGMLPDQEKENEEEIVEGTGKSKVKGKAKLQVERKELIMKYRRKNLDHGQVQQEGSLLHIERQILTQTN